MELMDLRGKSDQELNRMKLEMSRRDNLNAVTQISEFQAFFGKRVKVVKGRAVPRGTEGIVFWMGAKNYTGYADSWGNRTVTRIGIKDSRGAVHWTALNNVELVG